MTEIEHEVKELKKLHEFSKGQFKSRIDTPPTSKRKSKALTEDCVRVNLIIRRETRNKIKVDAYLQDVTMGEAIDQLYEKIDFRKILKD